MKLAPYAVSVNNSKGRLYQVESTSGRDPWERDKARILHSSAFRRLQYKTQVFENHEGDNFRTRLTHSLEVAQVAVTIAKSLKLNTALAETLALAHDLGHAPFGHTGQDVLNELMKDHGGFEHNFNTLRIGIEMESPYIEHRGLNLTYETLEGMLKHCTDKRAHGLIESQNLFLKKLGERFINRQSPSLESQVVDWADAIAYLHADMEDAINMGVLNPNDMASQSPKFKEYWSSTIKGNQQLKGNDARIIHQTIRFMMSDSITDLIETSSKILNNAKIKTISDVRNSPMLIQFSAQEKSEHFALKKASRKLIYDNPAINLPHIEQAEKIRFLFKKYENNTNFITGYIAEDPRGKYGQICDAIASQTDRGVDREINRIIQIEQTNKVVTKVLKFKK